MATNSNKDKGEDGCLIAILLIFFSIVSWICVWIVFGTKIAFGILLIISLSIIGLFVYLILNDKI